MSKLKKSEKPPKEDKPQGRNAAESPSASQGERAMQFKGYDLRELPLDALPFSNVEYKGKHSYTVPIQTAESRINIRIR